MSDARPVTLRCADPADGPALERIAQLDSAPAPPRAPVLVAEIDGRVLAAISLADGGLVADPFHPTAALVELLRARERQLRLGPRAVRGPRRRAWGLRRRAAATG